MPTPYRYFTWLVGSSTGVCQPTSASLVLYLVDPTAKGLGPGLLFMQDNASIHTSRLARQWFQENGIDVLEWPPYSPNLNPNEHLWYRLKKNVYDVRPDIEEVGGSKEHIQEVLYDALEQAWVRIEGSSIEGLVRSIEKRVKAVIASDGWYTKYQVQK